MLGQFQPRHMTIPPIYGYPPFYLTPTHGEHHYFSVPPQASHEMPEITHVGHTLLNKLK